MQSESESEVSKSISNETICRYFYILFIVTAVLAAIILLADVYLFATNPRAGLILMMRSAPTVVLAVLNSLFLYVLCYRSLLK